MCEASVRTDMVLPGVYQPDRSWAEAAVDKHPHPASSAFPFCSSLVPILPGGHRVLGTALARFGQWGSVECLSEKAPEAVPVLDPADSRMDPSPPKAEPASSDGGSSGIMYLRKSKNHCTALQIPVQWRGRGGGAPSARTEITCSPWG